MRCDHAPWGCKACRLAANPIQQPPLKVQEPRAPLAENRLTVETLQGMFDAEKTEVRRLVEENTRLRIENERLRTEAVEAKRKKRRRKK